MPGLLRALRRRWRLGLLGGLVLASIAAVAVYFLLPPAKFTASSMIYIAATRPKEIFETRESGVAYNTYQETQVILAKSRRVIDAATAQASVAQLPTVRKQADPSDWLGEQIKVDFPRGSEIMKISMTGSLPPQELEVLVNAVTDSYLDQIVEQEKKDRLARFERLKLLFEQLQKELREKRTSHKQLAEAMGTSNKQSTAIKQQMMAEQLGYARQELLRLNSEIREAQARMKVLKLREDEQQETVQGSPRTEIEQKVEVDPQVTELKKLLEESQGQLEAIKRTARKASDPAIYQLQQKITRFKKDLEKRRQAIRPVVVKYATTGAPGEPKKPLSESEQYLDILHEQETTLKNEITLLDKEMGSLTTKSMDFHWLEDDINLSGETAKTVGVEVQSMGVELKAPPRIRLLEKAKAPPQSDPLRRLKITAGTAVGVLFGYLALLAFWEFRARRIDSVNEVVDSLGLKLVGSLPPLPRLRSAGGEVIQQRLLIESIDSIRTMLLRASRFEPMRLVMVTSALKGEGKTSLSCHLATSLARSGRKTLLIDGDLRNPSVSRAFSAPRGPGVCEILRQETTLDDAIWQSPVASLYLLPAGSCDPAALELVGQDRLGEMLLTLRDRFDFVILDTAPVLLVTDTLIASQYVDCAIISILREVSQLPPVHAAYQKLSSLGVRIFGAVVAGVAQSSYAYKSYPYPATSAERNS